MAALWKIEQGILLYPQHFSTCCAEHYLQYFQTATADAKKKKKNKTLTVKREFKNPTISAITFYLKFSLRKMACEHQEACDQMEYKSKKQRTALH